MPLSSARAFVLSVTPFSEQDKLVHLLTINRGILKAIAPGSLKGRNRFGSLLELFTEGDFFYYWKENREIITLSKGDIVQSYFHTISDSRNIFYFYLIAEILLKFIPFNQKDQRTYRLLDAVLKNRQRHIAMAPLLLYFLVWILRIEGLMFNPDICYNCYARGMTQAWFKSDFRGILCQNCQKDEPYKLEEEELNWIRWSKNNPPGEKIEEWIGKIDVDKLIRLFTGKIGHHAECSFKSTQYLSQFR